MQTPQVDWLRVDLKDWMMDNVDYAISGKSKSWFNQKNVISEVDDFLNKKTDNSFFIWQLLSVQQFI